MAQKFGTEFAASAPARGYNIAPVQQVSRSFPSLVMRMAKKTDLKASITRLMKSLLLVAVTLEGLLTMDAAGQTKPMAKENRRGDVTEVILELNSSSPTLEGRIQALGGRVLAKGESDSRWLVRIGEKRTPALTKFPEIRSVKPSVDVLVELSSSATDGAALVDGAGGIVTHRYANVRAVSAWVPLTELPKLSAAAGVRRIHKQKIFLPTH
jgi:hypothetical protein